MEEFYSRHSSRPFNGCVGYTTATMNSELAFKFVELEAGEEIKECDAENSKMVFLLAGHLAVEVESAKKELYTGEMVIVPLVGKVLMRALTGVRMVFVSYNQDYMLCSQAFFQELMASIECRGVSPTNFCSLQMKPVLHRFFALLDDSMKFGGMPSEYYMLKVRELYILILHLYSLDELVDLFSPVVAKNESFRRFVLTNYERVNNVNQLIELSCMSKSLFFIKFKQEFGMTAKKWLIQRMNERICHLFAQPGVTVKDVMYKLNFSSPSHFSRYCVQQLGVSPREMLHKYSSVGAFLCFMWEAVV